MAELSKEQVNFYHENGYIAPIDIFSEDEALALRSELEMLERDHADAVTGKNRNNVHYVTPLFDGIAHHPKILDAVESLIGHNILVAGTTLFIKEPEQKGFISWHQDARYIGLEPYNWATAWLALSNVTTENGCMYMWPKSHHDGQRDHVDTFSEDNLLTRGQTVMDVPEDKIVPIQLRPGQLSIHHPWVVHGSSHNMSQTRRIGFAIQSYIGADVDQVLGNIYVQQARGDDPHGYHRHTPRPTATMAAEDIQFRDQANAALQDIFYHGAKRVGKY
ncbi:MAG: phytanoyl-CoA dioxygenase family protein [Candidatus Puniceispirillales bacterium WSBS_2018_MAG_OTU23]